MDNLDRFGEYPIWKNIAYLTAYGLAVKHGKKNGLLLWKQENSKSKLKTGNCTTKPLRKKSGQKSLSFPR